jgi:hypothetical protein
MPTSKGAAGFLIGLPTANSSPNLTSLQRPVQQPIVNRPVTDQEREAISALRQLLPQCVDYEDNCLLRWLRSKEGRFDETADALKKNTVFRKAWDLDRVADSWTAPEVKFRFN